jgi:hypothetical protein
MVSGFGWGPKVESRKKCSLTMMAPASLSSVFVPNRLPKQDQAPAASMCSSSSLSLPVDPWASKGKPRCRLPWYPTISRLHFVLIISLWRSHQVSFQSPRIIREDCTSWKAQEACSHRCQVLMSPKSLEVDPCNLSRRESNGNWDLPLHTGAKSWVLPSHLRSFRAISAVERAWKFRTYHFTRVPSHDESQVTWGRSMQS